MFSEHDSSCTPDAEFFTIQLCHRGLPYSRKLIVPRGRPVCIMENIPDLPWYVQLKYRLKGSTIKSHGRMVKYVYSAVLIPQVVRRQRCTPFIHVSVRFHGVVSWQLHSISALDLAKGELHSVVFVAPRRKPCHVGFKEVQDVSIFYLHGNMEFTGHMFIQKDGVEVIQIIWYLPEWTMLIGQHFTQSVTEITQPFYWTGLPNTTTYKLIKAQT